MNILKSNKNPQQLEALVDSLFQKISCEGGCNVCVELVEIDKQIVERAIKKLHSPIRLKYQTVAMPKRFSCPNFPGSWVPRVYSIPQISTDTPFLQPVLYKNSFLPEIPVGSVFRWPYDDRPRDCEFSTWNPPPSVEPQQQIHNGLLPNYYIATVQNCNLNTNDVNKVNLEELERQTHKLRLNSEGGSGDENKLPSSKLSTDVTNKPNRFRMVVSSLSDDRKLFSVGHHLQKHSTGLKAKKKELKAGKKIKASLFDEDGGSINETKKQKNTCDFCGKHFVSWRQLVRHKNLHSNVRRFKCMYCEKGFNDAFDLKRHTRTHTGVRPYRCEQCPKSFTQRCSLEAHSSKVHNIQLNYQFRERRPKLFVCELCGKTFTDNVAHKQHSIEHSSSRFTFD